MLVEQSRLKAFHESVARTDSSDLRPSDLGRPVVDLLQLQKEWVAVSVGPTRVLPTIEGRIRWIGVPSQLRGQAADRLARDSGKSTRSEDVLYGPNESCSCTPQGGETPPTLQCP